MTEGRKRGRKPKGYTEMQRTCLSCSDYFMAESPYLRLCYSCRRIATHDCGIDHRYVA
jgi:hypothetical protein